MLFVQSQKLGFQIRLHIRVQVYSKIDLYWNETWCISDDVYNQAVVAVAGLLTNRRKLTFHWLLETDRLRAAEAKVPM